MSNGDEYAMYINLIFFPGLYIGQLEPRKSHVISQHFFDYVVPQYCYIAAIFGTSAKQSFGKNCFGSELISAMYQPH